MTSKLQKVLANLGLASRREMEKWILEGRVKVNGILAKVGDRVSEKDEIKVDGKVVKAFSTMERSQSRIIAYHKPEGEICTRKDPQGRPTIFENLPSLSEGRWINVGRLDLNTSGLLLLTNDGELANRLMHPSFGLEREYLVRVLGKVTPEIINRLKKGVSLEDGQARFESVHIQNGVGANRWYKVVVKEGKNRLVRRLWESQDCKVSRLIRIRYGNISLPRTLKPGKWMEVTAI